MLKKKSKPYAASEKFYNSIKQGQLYRARARQVKRVIDFFSLSRSLDNLDSVYFKVTAKTSHSFETSSNGQTQFIKRYKIWLKPTKGARWNKSRRISFLEIKELLVKLSDSQTKTVNILYGHE